MYESLESLKEGTQGSPDMSDNYGPLIVVTRKKPGPKGRKAQSTSDLVHKPTRMVSKEGPTSDPNPIGDSPKVI